VIALRDPLCLDFAILSALTAGLWLTQPAAATRTQTWTCGTTLDLPQVPDFDRAPRPEPPVAELCDPATITNVVIRGQFTSDRPENFAISFAGAEGHYTAMTDERGYFEVRIPREDFAGDVCDVQKNFGNSFADQQMKLSYRIYAERE
jgi:hypothetical protein